MGRRSKNYFGDTGIADQAKAPVFDAELLRTYRDSLDAIKKEHERMHKSYNAKEASLATKIKAMEKAEEYFELTEWLKNSTPFFVGNKIMGVKSEQRFTFTDEEDLIVVLSTMTYQDVVNQFKGRKEHEYTRVRVSKVKFEVDDDDKGYGSLGVGTNTMWVSELKNGYQNVTEQVWKKHYDIMMKKANNHLKDALIKSPLLKPYKNLKLLNSKE